MFNKIDDILDSIKDGSLKVAKLAKETGIPAGRMYKWKDRGSKITSEDADVLLKWMERLDNSPKASQGAENTQDRYLALLEDNDKFFKDIVKTNLETAAIVQAATLAHLKAMIHADAEEKAAGDKRKYEKVLSAWNRRIAESLGLLERKDSFSTVGS